MKQLPMIDAKPAPAPAPTSGCTDGCCDPVEATLTPTVDTGCTDGCCDTAAQPTPSPTATLDAVEGQRIVMSIEGMDCASCAVTLERSVQKVDGVHRAVVNFAAARLDVVHGPAADEATVEAAVQRAGFRVVAPNGDGTSSYWSSTRARLTMLASALYVAGLALHFSSLDEAVLIAVFAASIALAGLPIFRSALTAIRARHLDMNVLMSAATVGAAILGEWTEAASVVVLFGIGNALQSHAIDRTRAAVRALATLTPTQATSLRDGQETEVEVAQIAIGDLYLVRPGERVAVDGEIVEGSSSLNEAPVTGESTPVDKGIGDKILSGTLNADGSLVARATRVAAESTVHQIARLVEQAQGTKAPTEQFVDRFSRVYTPIVVATAAALIVVPVLLGADAATWFYRGLALLIIACPCSLVISTPVTVVSAIGAASRRGLLIKGGAALEATGRLKALAFDKTGTLTEGRPVVTSLHVLRDDVDRDRALVLAASVERRSEHPLAHAILTAAAGLPLLEPADFTAVPGRGATATVEGRALYAGSPRLLREHDIALDPARATLDTIHKTGETPVVLADADGPIAVFGLSDSIRHDAPAALAELRRAGIDHIVMLTGDSEPAARRVANELGIEYRAELLPDDKLTAIRELHDEHGVVGMVGDGINDAPALAAASVSFAMGAAGSDVALESADVVLMQDDLGHLARAVRTSAGAERIIRQNVVFSIVVKGAFVVLAPFGLVTLWAAVLADMGTSLAVTGNGLRMFRGRATR